MEKKNTSKKGGFFASRRFKYGAVATVFVVVFIAAVILLNVVVSAIDSKYSLYIDMTKDQLFTIRESTVESVRTELDAYKEVVGQDFTITFTFLQARDNLATGQQTNWVLSLADSYAETFPEIRVDCREDLLTHPDNYAFYTDLGYTVTSDTVIVSSSLNRASFDLFTMDSCLVYDESGDNVWAFKGEMQFNKAIQSITAQEQPVVAFTTGHGESKPEKLVEIFLNCGFKVEDVDLSVEDVAEDVKILIISNPQKDFSALEDDRSVSEYTRLSDYLNDYRSILFIASPSMPELPVLDELMDDWGIQVQRNQIVMDDVSSVAGNNQMLIASYPESEHVASGITGSLTKLSSPPRSVSFITAPITITKPGDGDSREVEPVLTSSANSYVEVAGANGVERQSGPFNLMVVSTR
ncbi:MAG: Gldg family protein [Clostridia bacterium]|nr:Gldg family protein [Clostridia bacterium]